VSETTAPEEAPAPARRRRVPAAVSAVALVVIAAVALGIGSVGKSGPPSAAARTAALESAIRCPSCQDISVAQSDSSLAIGARHQITRMVAAGDSDAAVEQYFVDRYGPSILLEPPSSGLSSLIWILPLVAVVLALGALGTLFWRRGRALRALRAPR